MVHARIGNKGAINEKMCHPFVASEDEDEVVFNDGFVDKPVFIHNGTFFKVGSYSSVYSDSFFFARDYLGKKPLVNLLMEDPELFEDILDDKLNNSRVAVMFPNSDKEIITLGKFIEENGYLFSNIGYKNPDYRNVGGQSVIPYSGYTTHHSSNDYAKEKDEESEKATSEPVTQSNVASVSSVLDSDRVLEIFPTFSIPDDIITETVKDPITRYTYRKYLGFYVSTSKNIMPLRVVPTPLNFHHLGYQARVLLKTDFGNIDLLKKYKMGEFDTDGCFYKQSVHYLYHKDQSNPIGLSYNELETNFDIRPLVKYEEFYYQYLKLVTNTHPGQNTLKKLSKLLKASSNVERFSFGKINVDGTKADTKENKKKDRLYFLREVLELYLFNLCEYLFYNSEQNNNIEFYNKYLTYSF